MAASTSTSAPSRPGTPKRPLNRWVRLCLCVLAALVVLALVVAAANALRQVSPVQEWLTRYPGESALPPGAPVGFPAWLSWQHFLNSLLILLVIRTGWQVRTVQRPEAQWTRNNNGLLQTKGKPTKMSIHLWLHLSLDALWVLDGLVFYVLLFTSGQWMRIVPTNWDIFPNAASAALQYASLDWPLENGWVNYNALQVLAYFLVVFMAAPLAIATGLRMSPAWPKGRALDKLFPVTLARSIHFPVMLFMVLFIVVHVVLVMTTGALRNLGHMYAGSDDAGWLGFWFFGGSLAIMVAAWFLTRTAFIRPVASLTGTVTRR
jgi:thiosulfate reductase cytochrome b subunit